MLRMSIPCVLLLASLLCYATSDPPVLPKCKDASGKGLVGVPLERLYSVKGSEETVRYRCANPTNFQVDGQVVSGPTECTCPSNSVCQVDKSVLTEEDQNDPKFDMDGFLCRLKAEVEAAEKKLKDFTSGLNLGDDSDPAKNDGDRR